MNDENVEEETQTSGRSAKRLKRAVKRVASRPTTLKRKRPADKSAEKADAKPAGQTGAPAVKPRTSLRAKPSASKKKARAVTRKTPVPARKPPARQSQKKEEEYEIKSLPDGTQFKVRITGKSKPARRSAPRKRQGSDSGPGPAVVDLSALAPVSQTHVKTINTGSLVSMTSRSANYLTKRLDVAPKICVMLGSGLSSVADMVDGTPISFSSVPGFSKPSAPGHPGRIRAGDVAGAPVLFCEGRLHYYETGSMQKTVHPVQTFLGMGVEYFIFTTSAGAINPSFKVGDVMFVNDHLNLMGDNPMFGMAPDFDPSPFVDVSSIYDQTMIAKAERFCRRLRVKMRVGALAGMRGPVYETPAEMAWLRACGADAVCMSVIPEALAVAHAGAPVTALALIVNDKQSRGTLTHQGVVDKAKAGADGMKKIIGELISSLKRRR